MRLRLELPAGWQRDGDRATRGDAVLAWTPLGLLPDDQRAWIAGLLRRDLPAGARIEIAADDATHTALGWPLRRVDAVVVDAAGGVHEWRTLACYAFFEHAAAAVLRAPHEATYLAARAELRDALAAGAPDWSGEPACLHDLWDV